MLDLDWDLVEEWERGSVEEWKKGREKSGDFRENEQVKENVRWESEEV